MIKCPKCGSTNTKATNTRNSINDRIRRRKRCEDCGNLFTTYEVVLDDECYRFGGRVIDELFKRGKGGVKKGG